MPLRAAVYGEIDYAGAFSMQVRIAAACRRRRARGLIVDLSGSEFMSSSGLAALLNLQRESACLRGGMALASPTRRCGICWRSPASTGACWWWARVKRRRCCCCTAPPART